MSTASHDSTAPDSERGPAPDGSRAAIADETAALRDAFESGRTRSIRARLDQLDALRRALRSERDRKSTRLNSSHVAISYAVFCLKKKTRGRTSTTATSRSAPTA